MMATNIVFVSHIKKKKIIEEVVGDSHLSLISSSVPLL